MASTEQTANLFKGEMAYNKTMLNDLMERFSIKYRTVMAAFGQTNPTTVQNWMNGGNIYISALISLCNVFDLDILRFISFAEHTFKSSIVDLYRLEMCGLTVGDILRERGIEAFEEYYGSHQMRKQSDIDASIEARIEGDERAREQYQAYLAREEAHRVARLSATEVIKQITEIQRDAFKHEQRSLDALRKQKDMEINARDQTIMNLRILLARMGYQGMIGDDHACGEVADGSITPERADGTNGQAGDGSANSAE